MTPPKLKSMDELGKSKKITMLMFGEPGAWKTTTACRIGTEQGRVLLYSMNRDHRSLFNHSEYAEHVDVMEYENVWQIVELIQDLNAGVYDGYSTVVIDTISGWCDHFLRELAKNTKFGNNSRGTIQARPGSKLGIDFIKKMDLVARELSDYGILAIEIQEIVRALCATNKNIIFNCHSRLAENDKIDDWTHIRPDMPEGAYRSVIEEVDAMSYSKKKDNGIPTISFAGGKRIATKSRLAELENKSFAHPDAFVEVVNAYLASV